MLIKRIKKKKKKNMGGGGEKGENGANQHFLLFQKLFYESLFDQG